DGGEREPHAPDQESTRAPRARGGALRQVRRRLRCGNHGREKGHGGVRPQHHGAHDAGGGTGNGNRGEGGGTRGAGGTRCTRSPRGGKVRRRMTAKSGKAAGRKGEGRGRAAAPPPPPLAAERVFQGLGVSPGVAIGPAHVREAGALEVPEYHLKEGGIEAERQRLKEATERSRKQLHKLKVKAAGLSGAAGEELGILLDAHLRMLTGSRLLRGAERRISAERINAEAAVQAETLEITKGFAQMGDDYLASRADDINEVGTRLVRNLLKRPYQAFSALP